MRITTRIAAGGGRSLTRIPFPRAEMKDCLKAGTDKIDPVKIQLAFAAEEIEGFMPFTAASTDDARVYWAAATFLETFHDAYDGAIKSGADIATGTVTKQDERLEARMDRGKFVYARQDIRRCADGVRVALTVGNPYGIVGNAEEEARAFTATCCQLWLRIAEQVEWLRVEADAEIMEKAKANNAAADLRKKREPLKAMRVQCERRQGCYCSPCKMDCPLFRGGRCIEVEELEKEQENENGNGKEKTK